MYTYEIYPLSSWYEFIFSRLYRKKAFETFLVIFQQLARKINVSGTKEWSNIPLFTLVCLMDIYI